VKKRGGTSFQHFRQGFGGGCSLQVLFLDGYIYIYISANVYQCLPNTCTIHIDVLNPLYLRVRGHYHQDC
jgi:hypothetical protein